MSQRSPAESERTTLRQRLADARRVTDALFGLLSPDALYARPIAERHRVIFYLGHLEAFDWNLLGRTTYGRSSVNPAFDTLFAFGIDPVDGDLPDDRPADWPGPAEVREYVAEVRRRADRLLDTADLDHAECREPGRVFEVAIEHRLMHAETLAYMLHWLPLDWKRAPKGGQPDLPDHSRGPEEVMIPKGLATLGLSRDGDTFGWDNEFDLTRLDIPEFAIDRFDVSNGQFLEFVRSGGYETPSLWSESDWEWVSRAGVRHPRFWHRSEHGWALRTMFGVRPLPLSWPVYVSHAEASAYARWIGKSLPTEEQLHRAAYGTPEGEERPFPWGHEAPDPSRGNFDFERWDPVPVGSFPRGDSAFGVSDLLGNGWEWTSSAFRPFEGFEKFDFYPGYSADFFDENHFVMKGGSARTSACMLRRSFRNWFQAHYPGIYATFRCVSS